MVLIDMKKVLLTGAGGFVGSHVLEHLLVNTDWNIICICSWMHKGIPERIIDSKYYSQNRDRVEIITHDLVSPLNQKTIEKIGSIDYVLNIASESHVDRSINDPVLFTQNNVSLVLNMLELARIIKPEVFIQFSTDEVYGVAPEGVEHEEWSPIIPSNPYAASKAAQEAIAISYWRTYQVPIIITNTMNVIGERQDKEKYLMHCIDSILNGKTIKIHSYPDKKRAGSRFYIHARNVADGLLFILNNLPPTNYPNDNDVLIPDRYNIVGEKEVDNLTLAQMIANKLDKKLLYELVDFHSSRPGHDTRYALSGKKLANLEWTPPVKFEDSLNKTIEWTLENNWLK